MIANNQTDPELAQTAHTNDEQIAPQAGDKDMNKERNKIVLRGEGIILYCCQSDEAGRGRRASEGWIDTRETCGRTGRGSGGRESESTSASGELAGGRWGIFLFLRPARFPIPTSQNRRTGKGSGEVEREKNGGIKMERNKAR